jgi:hypothetical protein
VTGTLPDLNLSLDFAALIGKIQRQAAIASRSGQTEDLESISRELTRWNARLRRALLSALGEPDDTLVSWANIVHLVDHCRHERDGAQRLHQMAAEDLIQARQELEMLREEERNAQA